MKGKAILYPHAQWYFALAIGITWVGFSTSYFGKLTETDIYHHLHGATAGLWMVILVVQPMLYQRGKIKWHRKVGNWAVYILVPLLVLGGLKMMQLMISRQANYPPGIVYQLAWIDACSLLLFPGFILLSLRYRRNVHLHARYMAYTVLVLLPPAITRLLFLLPWFDSFNKTLNGSYTLIYLVLLCLLSDDARTGKVHLPYLVALLLFCLVHISMNFAADWGWWRSIMNGFSGYLP